jgi:uncharacterized protein (DUF2141 family)
MKKELRGIIIVLFSFVLGLNCTKTEEETGVNLGTGEGPIYVRGVLGRATLQYEYLPVETTLTFTEVRVLSPDSAGEPVTEAIVKINGTLLEYEGGFFTGDIPFQKNHLYTLTVESDTGHASVSVASPDLDSLRLTSPGAESVFQIGENISVSWEYFGGFPLSVNIVFYIEGQVKDSVLLVGKHVTYTIPGSKVDTTGLAFLSVYTRKYAPISGIAQGSQFEVLVGAATDFFIEDTSEQGKTGIQGSIRPEAGENIDVNNIRVQIYSDYDDYAGFNGLIKEVVATGSADEANYSVDLPAGIYYVVAWKDMNNDGIITDGDIYGFYRNDLGQPLAVSVPEGEMVTVDFTVYIYTTGGGGSNSITGTATLAAGVIGDLREAVASLYATPNDWASDNYLLRITVSGGGNIVSFSFTNLEDGTYYLDVWKDVDGSGSWTQGDLVGVYGTLDPTTGQASLTPITLSGGESKEVTVTVYQLGGSGKKAF